MGITSVKFRGRHSSLTAVFFMVTGIAAIVSLPALQAASVALGGTPDWMGFWGLGAVLMGVIGFAAGIKTMSERDVYMWQPLTATIVNGLDFILWLIVFTVGAVRAEGFI